MRNAFIHLRIPFSLLLLPSFLLACLETHATLWDINTLHAAFVWHFWIYPASQAFNTSFDQDEGSIGGLETPPPIPKYLTHFSLLWEALGLIYTGIFIPKLFWSAVLYGVVSKAYSHPSTRLKSYAFLSTFIVVFFQGAFVTASTSYALDSNTNFSFSIEPLLASLIVLTGYPMTQIFQHQEDQERGDQTLSLWLGTKGTLIFTAIAALFTNFLIGFVILKHTNLIFAFVSLFLMSITGIWSGMNLFKKLSKLSTIEYKDSHKSTFYSALVLNGILISASIWTYYHQ